MMELNSELKCGIKASIFWGDTCHYSIMWGDDRYCSLLPDAECGYQGHEVINLIFKDREMWRVCGFREAGL